MSSHIQLQALSQKVSVVIATLGGETLRATINSLNQGTIVPTEILICIPEREFHSVGEFNLANVHVIQTPFRGQVAQRAYGFIRAKYPLVMQLDDDMEIGNDCLEKMVNTMIEQGPKVAIGPALVSTKTCSSVYKKPKWPTVIQNIYYWVLNGSAGYAPGKVMKCGEPIGIDPAALTIPAVICDVDWLAGGCVLHSKKNLILENYFPFKGKAYCEDLIHSKLLSDSGVRLVVDPKASCGLIANNLQELDWGAFWKDLQGDMEARTYYLEMARYGKWRMYLFYLIRAMLYLAKRITYSSKT